MNSNLDCKRSYLELKRLSSLKVNNMHFNLTNSSVNDYHNLKQTHSKSEIPLNDYQLKCINFKLQQSYVVEAHLRNELLSTAVELRNSLNMLFKYGKNPLKYKNNKPNCVDKNIKEEKIDCNNTLKFSNCNKQFGNRIKYHSNLSMIDSSDDGENSAKEIDKSLVSIKLNICPHIGCGCVLSPDNLVDHMKNHFNECNKCYFYKDCNIHVRFRTFKEYFEHSHFKDWLKNNIDFEVSLVAFDHSGNVFVEPINKGIDDLYKNGKIKINNQNKLITNNSNTISDIVNNNHNNNKIKCDKTLIDKSDIKKNKSVSSYQKWLCPYTLRKQNRNGKRRRKKA